MPAPAAAASAAVVYVKRSSPDPCWGCSRRMQKWHESGREGPQPPRVARSTWERQRRDGEGNVVAYWPLCSPCKVTWEAHDLTAGGRMKR